MFLLWPNVLRLALFRGRMSCVFTKERHHAERPLANRALSLCLSLVSGDLPDIAERIPDHSAPVAVGEIRRFFERRRARI